MAQLLSKSTMGGKIIETVEGAQAKVDALTATKGKPNGIASLGADGKVLTEQLPKIGNSAADVSIADTGEYYTGTNTEEALQEIGQAMNAMRGSLIASVNSILQS